MVGALLPTRGHQIERAAGQYLLGFTTSSPPLCHRDLPPATDSPCPKTMIQPTRHPSERAPCSRGHQRGNLISPLKRRLRGPGAVGICCSSPKVLWVFDHSQCFDMVCSWIRSSSACELRPVNQASTCQPPHQCLGGLQLTR